jgi:hypothetical protein
VLENNGHGIHCAGGDFGKIPKHKHTQFKMLIRGKKGIRHAGDSKSFFDNHYLFKHQ